MPHDKSHTMLDNEHSPTTTGNNNIHRYWDVLCRCDLKRLKKIQLDILQLVFHVFDAEMILIMPSRERKGNGNASFGVGGKWELVGKLENEKKAEMFSWKWKGNWNEKAIPVHL
ncbi:hypothetical protein HELRODRAFT_165404 [Helobdella robusta]|uniref:Uncharacterized protein n=1 Tax=Helobdella robusta TaxID=6412 RepID=T1EWQ5_HELRO|nr:hypothetical protein HELRODRAFT_165404 [Helobdella robusta]ESN91375.1 hypothetical protein HELRODRAFT_165404 [Helobdella robusta]